MSILHICCNLAGSTVFPQLFEALESEGVEQVVFVPEKRKSDLGKNVPESVETYSALTVKKTDALFFFRKAQRSVPAIEKRVDMNKVKLIHAHTLFTDGSIAHKLHQKYKLPYVVTLRYSDIEAIWRYEPHLRPMARRILMDAAQVVFLGGAAKKKVFDEWLNLKEQPLIEKKSVIIPNGIRPEWLTGEARGPLGEAVTVGFAGRINKRKCPVDAVRAVHKAKEEMGREFRFIACGEGPLADAMIGEMDECDRYVGVAQGMNAMKRFYSQCDVLLVPSSAETFGMVYLEAMSQGVPVLYTRGQGFDGQFDEGAAGYSVICGDIAQQAEMIAKVTEDYEARSARCIELAKGYAWPAVAKKWVKLYRTVLEPWIVD